MNRSEIIELSNQLTERKGEKVLNLQSLYRFVVQDIAKRERFWWRRVQFGFTISIAGGATYDLTTITTTPSTALTEILLDEITKFTVILQPGTQQSPTSLQVQEMAPIFDPESINEIIYNNSQGFTAQPARYTMNPNDFKTLLIDNPNGTYQAYIVGWGMPNPGSDSANDVVPLIPPWGHNTIVAGINAKIFKFAYGSKNEKTVDAITEYEQGIQDLAQRKQFDPNYKVQLNISTEDASGAMSGAVRST